MQIIYAGEITMIQAGAGIVNEIYEPRQTPTQESAMEDLNRLDRPHQEANRVPHQGVDEEESVTVHARNGEAQVHQEERAHRNEQLFMTLLENEGLARIARCRDAFCSRPKAVVPFLSNKQNSFHNRIN